MYTDRNFQTKKALKEAVESRPDGAITVYQPGPFGGSVKDGPGTVEGPHGFHRWYARVTVKDGAIVKGSVK